MKLNITRLGVIMAGVALIATLSACRSGSTQTPTPSPGTLQSGSQGHPWGLPGHCVRMEGALTPECLAVAQSGGAPVCPYEDGDPSGQPCIWRDPDGTGWYLNDSSEYRD